MKRHRLPTGKLDMELLQQLLDGLHGDDPSVIVGPGVGRDVAILDAGGPEYLVAKTDPITFATDAIGYYCVTVNCNDIATCGGTPRWFLTTALLPEDQTTPQLVTDIFHQIDTACADIGVIPAGGHSEITYGLDRPILVGTMLGTVPKDSYITSAGAQVGDTILLTKSIAIEGTSLIVREKRDEAIEGTSLIVREKRDELLARDFEPEQLDAAAGLLFEPGLSVLPEARIVCQTADVHAMHDPTEGGLATGLWELAIASGVGMEIWKRDADVSEIV